MDLFSEIGKNEHLEYIDDVNGGVGFRFSELPFFEIPHDTRRLAFLYLDNSLSSITSFWSFMSSNHTLALLSPNLSDGFKAELEALYEPQYIYDPTRNNIAGYDSTKQGAAGLHYRQISAPYPIHEKIKVLLSTSGTTGSPKFVKLSEENLLANARSIIDYLPIGKSDVTPLNLPIYYSYGLSILTTNSLGGGKVVCSNTDVLNRAFWQKMNHYGYTSIAGVPFVYEMLERIGFRKNDYPSLRYLTAAGGKVDSAILKNFAEYSLARSIRFFVMYGQTEACARMSYLPPDKLMDKIGSIGIPIRDGAFTLDRKTQELCYKGPNVFGGYVSELGDLSSYHQPDWLHTGDLARMDDDGYYYITGRLKRFVKLFGSRVNLDEVESIAAGHAGTIVKCVGINDKALVMALVDRSVDASVLVSHVAEKTKIHYSALQVIFIEEFPLTENGKVDYNKIISLHATI